MPEFISTIVIGLLISVIGVINMTGNISSLHRYHRHRVTEENRKPFGRLVGLGTLIIGVSLILFGVLSILAESLMLDALVFVGVPLLLVCIALGLALTLYAMIKYNKGIF